MMNCPLKYPDEPCDPECAWLVRAHKSTVVECAIAVIAASGTEPMGFMPENYMERDAS